jgi:hypothetical protein
MGCEISADANEAIKRVPSQELERAPHSPDKDKSRIIVA